MRWTDLTASMVLHSQLMALNLYDSHWQLLEAPAAFSFLDLPSYFPLVLGEKKPDCRLTIHIFIGIEMTLLLTSWDISLSLQQSLFQKQHPPFLPFKYLDNVTISRKAETQIPHPHWFHDHIIKLVCRIQMFIKPLYPTLDADITCLKECIIENFHKGVICFFLFCRFLSKKTYLYR